MGGTRGHVLLTMQQISFAKLLAGNDKKTRDKGLKKLRNYFTSRSDGMDNMFSEDDFMRIWKGLYYCMWMSDKPLVQEELAENISNLVHCFKKVKSAVLFMKTFFSTMGIEWFGIDQHRLDKFLMLVRRFLRQTLVYCQQRDWDEDVVREVTAMFSSVVLSVPGASAGKPSQLGLVLHFIDIFPEELAKVSKGELPQHIMLEFLRPFLQHISDQDEGRTRSHVVQHIFHHLIKQSDMGIEYEEKFAAWKRAGFPGESCEDMERVELENPSDEDELDEDMEENWDSDIKDPRAGKVDVTLPQLQFDAGQVAEMILEYAKKAPVLKSRKVLYQLSEQFSDMAKGSYPLAFNMKVPEGLLKKKKGKSKKSELLDAAKRLILFEESLKKDSGKGKKRKHDDVAEDDVEKSYDVPEKYNRMQLTLTRCDKSEGNVRKKVKRKVSKIHQKSNGSSDLGEDILKLDRTHESVGEEVDSDSESEGLPLAQYMKVSRQKITNGIKHKLPAKLKKKSVLSLNKKQGKSTPVRKLQVHLNRWEVTDISKSPSQGLQEKEDTREMPLSEENLNPIKEITPSTTPVQESQPFEVKSRSPIQQKIVKTLTRKSLPNVTVGSAKKVNIVLQMNKEQKMADYMKAVKNSPSIPFDAAKKPAQGVLKPSPFSSPINPFYRRSGRRLTNVF